MKSTVLKSSPPDQIHYLARHLLLWPPIIRLPKILRKTNQAAADFITECAKLGTSEATIETAEKRGFETGLLARHPLDSSISLPVYIANFVLMEYGTGAIFGCPAHDQRDLDFANVYHLPVTPVVLPHEGKRRQFH